MTAAIRQFRNWRLFQRSSDVESSKQIIIWWEVRRLPFNLFVGIAGILTCLLVLGIVLFSDSIIEEPNGGGSPFLAVIAIFLYGIAANICYMGGWLAELFAKAVWEERAKHFAEIAFPLGLLFSILLTFVPVAVCLFLLLVKLINHHS